MIYMGDLADMAAVVNAAVKAIIAAVIGAKGGHVETEEPDKDWKLRLRYGKLKTPL